MLQCVSTVVTLLLDYHLQIPFHFLFRSLPSPSALSGPELEKRRKGLLEDSKSLVKQTQTALKNLQNAVEAAQNCGATVSELQKGTGMHMQLA